MAYNPNPLLVVDPYEAPRGPESPIETSPEDLRAFYEDMERREILERKLSKRKSNSGASVWSRKSVQHSTTSPPVQPTPTEPQRYASRVDLQEMGAEVGVAQIEERQDRDDSGPHLTTSRSVIVDARENAAWRENDAWAAVPLPTFTVKFNLHNPLGPRWYRNHHLIPPSHKRPSMRPPTFFSPSFPPMHTSSMPEHTDDTQGLSRTPSNSPLPTPTSSQTRVMDGGKPRSRKTSQTAPDTVDLLDLTDPWGTNWHHQSPYDIGQTTTVADNSEIPNRTRRASMTAMQSRHQSVTPSPLSQSTSAVHLHPAQPEIQIPRKLSKRHTPTVGSIFPSQPDETERKATSAPATPTDGMYISPSRDAAPSNSTSLPKRMSVAPPPVQSLTSKKEKRGSMLNRLAKKFSILRKPTEGAGSGSEWWHIDSPEAKRNLNAQTFERGRSSSPEKPHLDSLKRVPPPPMEPQAEPPPPPMESSQGANRLSLSSLETPYSMGRLTIANPDLPDSDKEAPVTSDVPPPPEKHKDLPRSPPDAQIQECIPIQTPPQSPVAPAFPIEARSRLDKPLPPPQIPTPQFSQLGLPDLNTPVISEQSLPPIPSQKSSPQRSHAHSPPPQTNIIHETPKRLPSQLRTTLPSPQNSSVPTDAVVGERSRTQSPPIDPPVLQETPKRSPSQLKLAAGLRKDPAARPDKDTIDPPTPTELPSVQTLAHHEPSRKTQSHMQESSSRNGVISPDTTPSRRNHAHEHTSSGHIPASHQPSEVRERPAEGSSSKRRSTRQARTQPRPEAIPAPVLVPFPTAQQEIPNHHLASYEAYEASPLSASSMLANPPTPYDHRLSLALSSDHTPPTLPPKSIYEGKTSHNVTPTDPSPSRQTETFKLVRSSSGNVYASSQTITAAGQQWEVVESMESRGYKEKSSSRTKDQEHRPRDHEQKSRARDQEPKSRETEYRARDSEHRSKDHDRRSKDYDRSSKDYEHRPRGYDRRTKESEPRYESRSKEYESKSQDHELRPKNYEPRDYEQRNKEHDYTYRSKESERRSKDYDHKRKDYEHSSRRESKSKTNVDNTDHHKSSHRSSKQPVHQEEFTQGRSNGKSGSRHEERARYEEASKSSRKRDEYRERRPERQATDTRSSSHHYSQSYPVPTQPPNPPSPPIRLERNPSLTARPTSELPSAADMNAMRAKESWEMERLWKARSMYGLEPNAPTTNFIPGPGSTSSRSDEAPTQGAVYGSSHTAYMVQTPFQSGRGTQIYHSMPTGPPPIIYSSPASIPSIPDSISSYEPYEHVYRPYPPTAVDYRSPPSMPRPALNNPLPEPPRESSYDPATLTSTRGGKRQSNDHWTKYNGITTAH